MVKRGSEDLKKLAVLQGGLVSPECILPIIRSNSHVIFVI